MRNWNETEDLILRAPLPRHEKTYTVIPHGVFLSEMRQKIESKGYSIESRRYLTAQDCNVICGTYIVSSGEDTEMAPSISFVNSYNKKRRAEIMASASVLICKNGIMAMVENGHYSRKHSGTALADFRIHVDMVIDGLATEFERLKINRDEMKLIELDRKTRALLVGDMLVNEQMLNTAQLNILQKEIKNSEYFKSNTLWSFYNHCTEAMKYNHPLLHDKQHIKFHTYISDKFELTGSRGLYGEPFIVNKKHTYELSEDLQN